MNHGRRKVEFEATGRVIVGSIDKGFLHRVESTLSAYGLEVVVASDGEKVLEIVFAGEVAAVFVDLDIPTIDGIQIAQMLKSDADHSTIGVTLTSPRTQVHDAARTAPGALSLVHSFTEAELIEVLHSMGLSK